jgi:hypothetical protein
MHRRAAELHHLLQLMGRDARAGRDDAMHDQVLDALIGERGEAV